MVGFDAKNKNILDKKFICPTCSMILRDPVQLVNCGHRICQSCLPENILIVQCSQCQIETSPNDIVSDRGFLSDMESIRINCYYCEWNDVLKNYQAHLDECHVLLCENLYVHCLLKQFGCEQQILRSELSSHYCSKQHQESILKIVTMLKSQLNNLQNTSDLHTNDDASSYASLLETVNIIERAVLSLGSDTQALNNETTEDMGKVHELLERAVQLKTGVEEENASISATQQNLEFSREDLRSLEQVINDNGRVSYDGTYVWKITNVQEKLRDAQSERQISIYSPPFYSSSTGYKMCMRLYLNGDGNARQTHMSLFFVLMRGPNDAILKFPFNYKVTFCLYDQTSQQRHIIDSFRPDTRSSSFQRPRTEMNIASGIPKFFPLNRIEQQDNPYVRDDTMFIKVLIDFDNIPKTLLPYALSLNVGLPNGFQQELIRLARERCTEKITK